MERFATPIAMIAFVTCLGCGAKVADQPTAATPSSTGPAATAPAEQGVGSPTDVVSLFLDRIRRGGEDSGAGQLLTDKAQSELARIGRTVQPIGSPDARFEVTRAEMIPSEPNSALVHSLWSEPAEDGSVSEYQVVWAVQKQAAQWRISGLAMELEPNQDPMIIDFENGARMAQLLSAPEESTNSAAATSEAPAAAGTISR